MTNFIKFLNENQSKIKWVSLAILVLIIVFEAGFFIGLWQPKPPITLISPQDLNPNFSNDFFDKIQVLYEAKRGGGFEADNQIVGSRFGKYYYTSSCKAAKKLKKENLIIFKSIAEAESLGYKPSKSCF